MMNINELPTDPRKLRWIEIQFYFILYDIWHMHQNFKDILDFIKAISFFDKTLDISKTASLAQDALINRRFQINFEEYVLLGWLHNVPHTAFHKYRKIHKLTICRLIQDYMKNPDKYYFYARNQPEDIIYMQQFVNAVDKMRGVGVTWTYKFSRRTKNYSNRWEPKLSH
jgi:hypothetical protein